MKHLLTTLLIVVLFSYSAMAQGPPPPPPPDPLDNPSTAVPIDNEVALLLFAASVYGGYMLKRKRKAVKL